jgi:hypothetical protein
MTNTQSSHTHAKGSWGKKSTLNMVTLNDNMFLSYEGK